MPSLYKIDQAIRDAIDSLVDPETGELNEAADWDVEALEMDRDDKLRAYAAILLEWGGDAESAGKEQKRLGDRKAQIERRIAGLEKLLCDSAPPLDQPIKRGTKGTRVVLEDAIFPISYTTSEQLKILDVEQIPKTSKFFTKVPATLKLETAAVKAALKNDEDVPGAEIEQHFNLRIGK